MTVQLYLGDSHTVLVEQIEPGSIDSIVTDPPYGLVSTVKRFGKPGSAPAKSEGATGVYQRASAGFMGQQWDGTGIEQDPEFWRRCFDVLKPGGHLLAFGGTRTWHRIAVAIEDAGFEVRDTLMWLYGTGFPKSHNTALMIDKKNGQTNRGHRIAVASRTHPDGTIEPNGDKLTAYKARTADATPWEDWGTNLKPAWEPVIVARKPLIGTVATNVLAYSTGALNIGATRVGDRWPANVVGSDDMPQDFWRFFYTTKASKKDRNTDWQGREIETKNTHPTVKPTDLMEWLVRLVTPPGGTVLDPFMGSGSTGKAARRQGFNFVGIEADQRFFQIAVERCGADNGSDFETALAALLVAVQRNTEARRA